MPSRRSIHTSTEFKPITRDLQSAAGTSGQEGAGKATLHEQPREEESVLGTEDGLVPNEAVTYVDEKGYLEATDENDLFADLEDDIDAELAESSTAYPSIAGARGMARDTSHDADTPLTTEYPNYTRRLRDTPV